MCWSRRIAVAVFAGITTVMLPPAPAAPEAGAAPTALELYTARRDAEAEKAFEQQLAADPADHEAVYYLGRLAKRRGDWAAVAERYEQCTRIAPAVALYWADLGEAYGKLTRKAGLFQQLSLARKCHAALEKAVALEPENLEYRQGLISFCEKAPSIAGGGRDKALAQAAALARFDPFAGAMETGGIHARAEEHAAAAIAFREAARTRPEADEPLVALARALSASGQFPGAFAALDTVRQRHPDSPEALFLLGRVAADSGQRTAEGAAALRRFLALEHRPADVPTEAQAQLLLGDLLAAGGDNGAARGAYETALRLQPDLKAAAEALGRLQR